MDLSRKLSSQMARVQGLVASSPATQQQVQENGAMLILLIASYQFAFEKLQGFVHLEPQKNQGIFLQSVLELKNHVAEVQSLVDKFESEIAQLNSSNG